MDGTDTATATATGTGIATNNQKQMQMHKQKQIQKDSVESSSPSPSSSSATSSSAAGSASPIPYKRVILLGLILSANNTSIWMIFSFLPFMVQHFFPMLSKEELGYHAGMLGSAFSAGSLFGNIIWGVVSDRFGRRPALLMGLFGTAVCAIAFGFAPSFLFAIIARFMWGLLNGNIGVAKTYLGEISDDSNAAKGMALFGVIGGFGRTMGPVIGGFLSSPADNYPSVFNGTIFETYPFALPAIVIAFYCSIVFVISFCLLTETLPTENISPLCCCIPSNDGYSLLHGKDDKFNNSIDIELTGNNSPQKSIDDDDDTRSSISDESQSRLLSKKKHGKTGLSANKRRLTFSNVVKVKVIDDTSNTIGFKPLKGIQEDENPILKSDSVLSPTAADVENSSIHVDRYTNGSEDESIVNEKKSCLSMIAGALRRKPILITTLMYGTNALVAIVVNEIFPLWLVTSRAKGGFQFDEHQIGTTTMVGGVLSVIMQIVLYPKLIDMVGILAVIKLGIFFFAVGCIITPALSVVNHLHSPTVEWITVTGCQLLLGVTSTWVLVSVFVLINNSCYSYQRATVNGIGQTFASLGRLCGPYVGAVTFAWSETNNLGWPFNFHFVFYMLVVISVINWCITSMLPYNIQRRRREAVIPTEEQVEEYLRYTLPPSNNSHKPVIKEIQPQPAISVEEIQSTLVNEVGGAFDYSSVPNSADSR